MPFHEIFKSLNIALPEEITESLNEHSRIQKARDYILRLLNQEEMAEMLEFMSDLDGFQDLIPVWTDDNSNYVCIYGRGPLSHRVCYMNHEETDLSPGFRSVGSFLAALETDPQNDWDDLQKDYPSKQSENIDWIAADLASIGQINLILQESDLDDEVRCQHIYSLMSLTPYNELHTLLCYLDDEDMYVQERACDIFGYHRYLPAKEKLQEVLEQGMHNGKSAAKRALARIGKTQAGGLG